MLIRPLRRRLSESPSCKRNLSMCLLRATSRHVRFMSRQASPFVPTKSLQNACFIGRAWPNFPAFCTTFRNKTNKKVAQVWALCRSFYLQRGSKGCCNIWCVHVQTSLSKKQSRIMSLLWGRCSRDGIFDWSLMTPCDVFEKFLFFWATVHAGKIFICIPHSTSLFLFHIRSSSSEPRLRCKRCINFTNSQPRTSGNQIINICRAQATTQEFG